MAIAISVRAALRASGGLNAGTPVAIASVPVSATAPRGERPQQDQDRDVRGGLLGRRDHLGLGAGPVSPANRIRNVPDADHQERRAEEQVGRDREDVARLAEAAEVAERDQADRDDRAISTRTGSSAGIADASCSTADDVDTATVSM